MAVAAHVMAVDAPGLAQLLLVAYPALHEHVRFEVLQRRLADQTFFLHIEPPIATYERSQLLSLYFKHIQQAAESVLAVQAGIGQPASFVLPFGQAPVVVQLLVILDEEGDDAMAETLLEGDEPADPAVAVLERMNALKLPVKPNDVVDGDGLGGLISGEQVFHAGGNILWLGGLKATDHVGALLVVAHSEPRQSGILGSLFQDAVQFFDNGFGERRLRLVYHVVNSPEVVDGLDDVIHRDGLVHGDGTGLKDEPRLLLV